MTKHLTTNRTVHKQQKTSNIKQVTTKKTSYPDGHEDPSHEDPRWSRRPEMVTKTPDGLPRSSGESPTRDSGCLLRSHACGLRVRPLYHLLTAQKSRRFRTLTPGFTTQNRCTRNEKFQNLNTTVYSTKQTYSDT